MTHIHHEFDGLADTFDFDAVYLEVRSECLVTAC